MDKTALISMFGTDGIHTIADTLGITRQAVHMWPDEVSINIIDRIIGASVRKNLDFPRELLAIKETPPKEAT